MMVRPVCLGVLASLACRPAQTPGPAPAEVASPRVRSLGPGDVLEIRVRDQEDLSGPYDVAEDGTIRFPWIGVVDIRGMSPAEIAGALEARLADGWLKQPQVAVRVTERQNREVSVLGQVKDAGSYPYKSGLTLMQAISLAGGMNPLAMPRRVKLIRETQEGRKTFEIDVTAILSSRQKDWPLEPGDIVFVPESPV